MNSETEQFCSVCFEPLEDSFTLAQCGCSFCRPCVLSYLRVRVLSGDVIDIPCLSSSCKQQFTDDEVVDLLKSTDLTDRYLRYKGNRDVERDPNRTFCPNPLCSCVCDIPPLKPQENDNSAIDPAVTAATTPRAVTCQQCGFVFCSLCHSSWSPVEVATSGIDSPQAHHQLRSTASNLPMGNKFLNNDNSQQGPHQCEVTYVVNRQRWNLLSRIGIDVSADDVMIKRCPCCGIPVERGPGCAQMLCLNCHHTFCWYCLTVLDGDVFLRHYESGVCRARLGHTPGDLRRHRARVAMALTCCGFVAVLLLPVIVVCSPCILTCVCCVRSLINNSARDAQNGATPRALSSSRPFSGRFDAAAVQVRNSTTTPQQQQQQNQKSPSHSIDMAAATINNSLV